MGQKKGFYLSSENKKYRAPKNLEKNRRNSLTFVGSCATVIKESTEKEIIMLSITDFFDVANAEHREAYHEMEISGHWPEGFIPDDIDMSPAWHVVLLQKMYEWYRKRETELQEENENLKFSL